MADVLLSGGGQSKGMLKNQGLGLGRRRFITATAAALAANALGAGKRSPNVVLILADNLGYEDLGCYGSIIRTPNLDRIAAEGVRFTHAYCANPISSPARAGLLTGRYPPRAGVPQLVHATSTYGLPASEVTIAQMLKDAGYRTCCVGKWHLGHTPEYLPTRRGFDQFLGIPYSRDMSPLPLIRDTQIVDASSKLEEQTQVFTEAALEFIRKSKDLPFFLYFAHSSPHPPQAASARFKGKSPAGLYGDDVEEMDWSVGQVIDALKRTGVDRETLVLFVSDNGPYNLGNPGRLRERLGSTYEGGMRVPFIARFPGRIPKGRTSDAVVTALDVLPTVARLCDAKLPAKQLDGIDIWPIMAAHQRHLEREALLYFDYVNIQCARLGRYKLHISRYNTPGHHPQPNRYNLPLHPPELYDVLNDPGEGYDIASIHPDIVAEIQARIQKLLVTMPEDVQKAFVETQNRQVLEKFRIGLRPVLRGKP